MMEEKHEEQGSIPAPVEPRRKKKEDRIPLRHRPPASSLERSSPPISPSSSSPSPFQKQNPKKKKEPGKRRRRRTKKKRKNKIDPDLASPTPFLFPIPFNCVKESRRRKEKERKGDLNTDYPFNFPFYTYIRTYVINNHLSFINSTTLPHFVIYFHFSHFLLF